MEDYAWHALEMDDVVRILEGSREGISLAEVVRRQKKYGKNTLPEPGRVSAYRIFLRQFTSPLVALLGGAGIVSLFLGDVMDTVSIFVVLFLNACLGFFQEYRADRRMQALRALVKVLVTVQRGGAMVQISADDLVPGDVLFLRPGMRIGADARLLEVNDFATYEAVLTGESGEVEKKKEKIAEAVAVFEQSNMVFMGTSVARGTARACVVATGSRTFFAGIARESRVVEKRENSFQKELQHTAKRITWGVFILATILFFFGIFTGEAPVHMLQVSIALAVAAVPEGLLIATTVALAVALQRMAKQRILARTLSVPERLSAVNMVCVDKTGTLTTGNMEVDVCDTTQPELVRIALSGLTAQSRSHASLALSLTEQALARYVLREGVEEVAIVESVPFSSQKKYSEVTLQTPQGARTFCLGAPEVLLVSLHGESSLLVSLQDRAKALAIRGLRVLMLVERHERSAQSTFLAFFGIADPLRIDAQEMITRLTQQGVRLMMLTGDHQDTAQVIAQRLSLQGSCVQGKDLQHLSQANLIKALRGVSVVARMIPQDKLRIVRALQADGYVVAMTGDGVNDSPALAAADVGIALHSGTDVAREVADLVLLDDRLSTISLALQEGRGTFLGLQRIIAYLIMLSLSEMAVFVCALVLGGPLPLSPVQVLWLNVLADGIPAFGLAAFISYDLSEVTHPRPRLAGIFSPSLRAFIVWGIVVLILPLCVVFFFTQSMPSAVRSGLFFSAFVLDALFALWLFAHVRRLQTACILLGISFVGFCASAVPFFLFPLHMSIPSPMLLFGLCMLSFIKCLVLWGIWRVILGQSAHVGRTLVS